MKPVKVYTTTYCPYCQRVKSLLKQKSVEFQEIDLTENDALREKLQQQTGWMTVPMVFIGEEFVGGSDDLSELEASGELDKKLKA